MRFYLPEGVPVIQDLVPPLGSDGASTRAQSRLTAAGQPTTLLSILSTLFPLLFPPRSTNMTASFVSARPLGRAIVQGIDCPLDAHVAWLGSALAGADGWCAVVIVL